MSLRTNSLYQYRSSGCRIRVLAIDECNDVAVTISLGVREKRRLSARPEKQSLSKLRDEVDLRELLPLEVSTVATPPSLLKGKARVKADKISDALQSLAEMNPLELADQQLTPHLRRAAQKLGVTVNAVNMMFTKVMQSGMCLSAAFPQWDKCGRQPAVVDGQHCVAKPTNQPNSYPLSLADIARIRRGAKEFLVGETTWREAHDAFLEKHYPVGIKVVNGEEIVVVLPKGKRPSFGQFYRHARAHLRIVRRIIQKVGKDMFLRDHAGKPIGQAFAALRPGHESEIDWTTTGLVAVRRGTRLSVGTLIVYVVVDVYTGYIQSIYLTLGNGCVEEASRAILLCLEDKMELCKRYGITIRPEQWAGRHLSPLLTSDRGELNSWKSSNLVTGLGITMKLTRSKFARDKGTVESINSQIKRILRRLAGGTFGHKVRGEKSPHIEAIYDFDQTYRILLAFAIWHNAKLRENQPLTEAMVAEGLHRRPTPNSLWAYCERHGYAREFALEEARAQALPYRRAAVTERGIQIENLRFKIPVLDPKKPGGIDANVWLAEARKKRWEVDLGIDEATVDLVWLRHAPQGGDPILIACPLVESQRPAYSGLSWPEYRSINDEAVVAKDQYREEDFREATAVFRAILKRTTKEAEAMTKAAREGLSKARLVAGIDENRANEAAERRTAAEKGDSVTTTEGFEEYFGD